MYIIGVTGQSCSGKTTLSRQLQRILGDESCLLISMDDYYKELSEDQYNVLKSDEAQINFDTPESIDFDLLKTTLTSLKQNTHELKLPSFNVEKCVIDSWTTVKPDRYKYIILEGLFIFYDADIAKLFDLKIWVETSDYVCALRRFMKFSRLLKGYSHEYIYNQCIKYVIPGQEKYIKPIKRFCNYFVNGEIDDRICVDMVVDYIRKLTL